MQCSLCSRPFDSDKNVPRLLIKCGHTFGQACLEKIFSEGCITCPICGTKNYGETIEDFPKNLALLDVNLGAKGR